MGKIFRKSIQTGSFYVFKNNTLKVCTFSLSGIAFLKWCLKINICLWVCAQVLLTWSFRGWQQSAEVFPMLSVLQPPSQHHWWLSLPPPSSLFLVLECTFSVEWITLYCSHLINRLYCPHTPAGLPYLCELVLTFCQESILLILPACQTYFKYLLSATSPWNLPRQSSLPVPLLSKPRQKAAYCGGIKMILGVLWNWCQILALQFTSWGTSVCYWTSVPHSFCMYFPPPENTVRNKCDSRYKGSSSERDLKEFECSFLPPSEVLSHYICHSLADQSYSFLPCIRVFMCMFYLTFYVKPKCTCPLLAAL